MSNTFSSLFYGPVPQLSEPTAAQLEALRQQVITETEPGSVLRDFQTLLDAIGNEGVEVSPTHHWFSAAFLTALNPRLSRTIDLGQKRSQQKCYPQIHGLYLLLRASGLSQIESQGKQCWLRLDPAGLAAWHQLNPTERYFLLLEAWLIWGNDEILGEPLNLCRRFYDNLGRCLILWQFIPDQGLQLTEANQQQEFGYCPGLHNLALLELFGWATVRSDATKPGWQIQEVRRSELGDAMLALLGQWTERELNRLEGKSELNGNAIAAISRSSDNLFGKWQALLQPYFPAWQQTFNLPQTDFRPGVYTFKVSLCKIWRRIVISGDASLDDLSGIILHSVDFNENQLYCFSFKNRFGWTLRINHPFLQEGPYTFRYRVGELPLAKGSRLLYLFDFGEQWEFDIKLEQIAPPDPTLTRPRIIECHGEPPEQYPTWDEAEVTWDSLGA
jgi:hypothetical protein